MPEIVKMNAAHVAEIAEIEKVSFKTPWSAQMIADELKNPLAHYFVIEKAGQVLAYMGYYRILDEAHITRRKTQGLRQSSALIRSGRDERCRRFKSNA